MDAEGVQVSLFEAYDPDGRRGPPLVEGALQIRKGELRDLEPLVEIAVEREGGGASRRRESLERVLQTSRRGETALLLVAEHCGEVIAYGKVGCFTPPEERPANCAPAGWYLGGLIVRPPFRRRGLGTRLTVERLRWLAGRTMRVHSFTNALNRAAIALHHKLAFHELTRDFWFPGVTFVGSVGVLFEKRLAAGSRDAGLREAPSPAPSSGPRSNT